ncbi:MAG: ribose 5-phosphate isomerase B [Bacteroidales bacterium]|jgi:ribose 5-phosphate isomerase B|nr:ribose 5-phosphate isomerase B [Bacteroidales bacterium]
MKIPIASDHAGFEMKNAIIEMLKDDFDFEDMGTHSPESVDYPDYARKVVMAIKEKPELKGILLCGSGEGMQMTANKYGFIRAALCWNTEVARLTRMHNDANVLVLPARFISLKEAIKCVKIFFSTEFEGGRHILRLEKMKRS